MLTILKDIPLSKIIKYGLSYMRGIIRFNSNADNFEDVMVSRVGWEAYKSFYEDYAFKLWGVDPRKISADVGKRGRFLGGLDVFSKILFRKIDYYLYPRHGIGEISDRLSRKIRDNGGNIQLSSKVVSVNQEDGIIKSVEYESPDGNKVVESSFVISTIPPDELYGMSFGMEANEPLGWRGMRILYLLLEEKVPGDCETFYFPGSNIIFGRVSELNKYSTDLNSSISGSLLTIEIPSTVGDDNWNMDESLLLEKCIKDLIKVKILDSQPTILDHFYTTWDKAYPLKTIGWHEKFKSIFDGLSSIKNLFIIGRTGLYLHCNIDHSIRQALDLSEFIQHDDIEDKEKWEEKACKFQNFCARE